MLGLTVSYKLDWGSYIISIFKSASNKIGAFICSMKFLSPEVALYLENTENTWPPVVQLTFLFYREFEMAVFPECSPLQGDSLLCCHRKHRERLPLVDMLFIIIFLCLCEYIAHGSYWLFSLFSSFIFYIKMRL